MDIEKAITILNEDDDFRVLRRVNISDRHCFNEDIGQEPVGTLAVIDTETTGFSPDSGDRIIDLAIAICSYGQNTGTLHKITSRYEGFEDPEMEIPDSVCKLTGITNDMVKDKYIDESKVAEVLKGVGLIICHNAAFDRHFLESRFPAFANKNFSCSLNEIPWISWGLESKKLDYLGYRYGFFHQGHRARADVDMLLTVLNEKNPSEDVNILSSLLSYARQTTYRIYATGLPFGAKEHAKARGYRWSDGRDGRPKAWWIDTADDVVELTFLSDLGCSSPAVKKLTAKERYRPIDP